MIRSLLVGIAAAVVFALFYGSLGAPPFTTGVTAP